MRAVCTLVLALGLSGCATTRSDFTVALPNGYYLMRASDEHVQLRSRGGRVTVDGPIAAYGVYRDIVTGAIGEWAPREGGYPNAVPFKGTDDSKYFVLETDSGKVMKDLAPDAWRSQLKELGVPQDVEITAPVLPNA